MSRPRFLVDNDLMDQIVLGVMRREPTLVMTQRGHWPQPK